MFAVNILIIPHEQQRYPTVGDWWWDEAPIKDSDLTKLILQIRVSSMNNFAYEVLVAQHEFTEAILCNQRGIKEKDVTAFDVWYENERIRDNPDCQLEPGDHKFAPYRKEHFFATSQERAMAAELGVDWSEYDKAVNEL